MCFMSTLYSYLLQLKMSWVLMSSEKAIHCWSLVYITVSLWRASAPLWISMTSLLSREWKRERQSDKHLSHWLYLIISSDYIAIASQNVLLTLQVILFAKNLTQTISSNKYKVGNIISLVWLSFIVEEWKILKYHWKRLSLVYYQTWCIQNIHNF